MPLSSRRFLLKKSGVIAAGATALAIAGINPLEISKFVVNDRELKVAAATSSSLVLPFVTVTPNGGPGGDGGDFGSNTPNTITNGINEAENSFSSDTGGWVFIWGPYIYPVRGSITQSSKSIRTSGVNLAKTTIANLGLGTTLQANGASFTMMYLKQFGELEWLNLDGGIGTANGMTGVKSSEDCFIEHCMFTRFGQYFINLPSNSFNIWIESCEFETNVSGTTAGVYVASKAQSGKAGVLGANISNCHFGFTNRAPGVLLADGAQSVLIGPSNFTQTVLLQVADNATVTDVLCFNNIIGPLRQTNSSMIQIGKSANLRNFYICDNIANGGSTSGCYFISTGSGSSGTNCAIIGGAVSGFSSTFSESGLVFSKDDLVGYNPVGILTAPSVTTSATANNSGVKVQVFLTIGSTSTTVTKNSTSLGSFSSATLTIDLGWNETITLSQTTGVSWKWFGE